MESVITSLQALGTVTGLLALVNIILIDIVMSGDNAILIGMATRNLQGKERKQAIFIGIMLATVLRIVFAFFAVYLLSVVGLKFAGGLLLLYVVWKFYRELRLAEHPDHHAEVKKAGLLAAIYTIIIADVSMSLDNVLAVAGAAHGNVVALGIGLVVSIILMAFASSLIAKYLDRYPQIQWLGLFVILFVAIEMILSGIGELEQKVVHTNILPFVIFVIGGWMAILQQKYIRAADEEAVRKWMAKNSLILSLGAIFKITILLFFGVPILVYVQSHPVLFYALLLILLFVALELVSMMRKRK